MDSGKLIDVSSFLLFEASGDSEQLESDPGYGIDLDKDDDAESCSCEFSENVCPVDDDDDDDDDDEELDCLDSRCYDDYYHDHEDEEDGNDQALTSKPMGLQRLGFGSMSGTRKSGVCVDSSKGASSEMEKSRLFWEACLAS